MRKTVSLALALALVMAATPAGATVLTFEQTGVERRDAVPSSYGDNVQPTCTDEGCCDDHGCYGTGNGFTPNVAVEYATRSKFTGALVFDYLRFWEMDRYGNTYGDLNHVAYAAQDDKLAEISLVPEPGYRVVLNGFDLAGWDLEDVEHQMVRIVDGQGRVLLDYVDVIVDGGTLATVDAASNSGSSGSGSTTVLTGSHSVIRFNPPLVSSDGLRIRFGTSISIAIDNVDFDQQKDTPNPPTECQADLTCQADLSEVTSELLACQAALASHDEEIAVLEEAMASQAEDYEAEIARLKADADHDGVRDLDDDCAATPAGMAVDGDGCSQDQFCAKVDATTRTGRRLCPRLDWMNDEPMMRAKAERDCAFDRGGPGASDDRCVGA